MSIATCHTEGCGNAEVPVTVDDSLIADGSPVKCGGCQQQITDIVPDPQEASA